MRLKLIAASLIALGMAGGALAQTATTPQQQDPGVDAGSEPRVEQGTMAPAPIDPNATYSTRDGSMAVMPMTRDTGCPEQQPEASPANSNMQLSQGNGCD